MAAIMGGLEAEAYDRQYSDRELLRRIAAYFKPYRGKMIIITLAVLLMAGGSAALPLVVSSGVNAMALEKADTMAPLLVALVFITGVGVWALNWLRRQLTTEVIADVVLAIRQDGFAVAARQDLSFYDEFSSGRIVSRITSDTQEFGEVIILSTDVLN
ncbi:MAG: ABC transporter transmembrane domain-containing protein, partial [Anaerolineae bacterium]